MKTSYQLCGTAFMDENLRLVLSSGKTRAFLSARELLSAFPEFHFDKLKRSGFRSRMYAAAAACLLEDLNLVDLPKQTAVLGFGNTGCVTENLAFWNDFTENGRTEGRGHLFVGTLPTTPAAECAIAFDIHGPVYYSDICSFDTCGGGLEEELEFLFGPAGIKCVLVLLDRDDGFEVQVYCGANQ